MGWTERRPRCRGVRNGIESDRKRSPGRPEEVYRRSIVDEGLMARPEP